MTIDLNDADPQRGFDLIPTGTIVSVQWTIRPGGAGEDGWLKRSSDGGCEMLDSEFTIIDGEHARRKVWQSLILNGSTEGHATAAEISRTFLRAAVESVRNIKPDDVSPEAYERRKVDYSDLNGLCFTARVYVEKSKDPAYPDKNKLDPIPPGRKEWQQVAQLPPPPTQGNGGMAATPPASVTGKPAQPITRPEWA